MTGNSFDIPIPFYSHTTQRIIHINSNDYNKLFNSTVIFQSFGMH